MLRRLIPGLVTFAASAVLVLAGWQFAQDLARWQAGASVLPQVQSPASEGVDVAGDSLQPTERRWLPIFGMSRRNVPPQATAGTAAFDYELKGVVATGNMRWAVLTKAGQDLLVREGDRLDDDSEILVIHAEGLDVQLPDRVESLGFADNRPVAIQRVAGEPAQRKAAGERFATMLPPKETTELIFQDMTPDDIRKILQKAEANRREKGIVLENR